MIARPMTLTTVPAMSAYATAPAAARAARSGSPSPWRRAARAVTLGFADERRGKDPRALHLGEISLVRHAAHQAHALLRAAAAQSHEPRDDAGDGAGAGETVAVDAESQIAIDARRVAGQHAAVGVAHRLAVLGGAPGVPVQLALAGAVGRGGAPRPAEAAPPRRGERSARRRAGAPISSTTRRAMLVSAPPAGDCGSATTTGRPASAMSGTPACSGTWPISGTPSSLASRSPPPAVNSSERSPQCGQT